MYYVLVACFPAFETLHALEWNAIQAIFHASAFKLPQVCIRHTTHRAIVVRFGVAHSETLHLLKQCQWIRPPRMPECQARDGPAVVNADNLMMRVEFEINDG